MSERYVRVGLENAKFLGGFWGDRLALIAKEVIPYQWDALNDNIPGAEPSHAVENFRIAAGESSGEFKGLMFQDSDVAKWMEAASYSLASFPDAELEATLDSLVELMGKAQRSDGYLNTYFTVARPDARWSDFSFGHELYCAGHLIEAAVAYHRVRGKKAFLDIMCRYADYIDSVIGPEEGKKHVYCGHPEIELALFKLYKETGERRYLSLSEYFVDERGRQPSFLKSEPTFSGPGKTTWFDLDYHQAHKPVREQDRAEGHAVRAMYLYSAMADLAAETGDPKLASVLAKLWHDTTRGKMYVTGGLGSHAVGERFSLPYDLPNDTAYTETCAAIGLVLWASRMLLLKPDREYADVMERALYNNVLSGLSLDGKRYFYVNPLEVAPHLDGFRSDLEHVKTERVQWFGCACCPPNIARLISSLGDYICTVDPSSATIFVNLYAEGEFTVRLAATTVMLREKTRYPWSGRIEFSVESEGESSFTLAFRIPSWSKDYSCRVNGRPCEGTISPQGYFLLTRAWRNGDSVELILDMQARFVFADPLVREDAGKLALQRGPLVYCLEEIDNGPDLHAITVSPDVRISESYDPDALGGVVSLSLEARRDDTSRRPDHPYASAAPSTRSVTIIALPYFAWCNRSPGEMIVWIRAGFPRPNP
jgi:DUF1680 family protein